jgi:drug/metabolite transporter (DMT)-like permease
LKSPLKAHLALVGTNIFFAINFTAVKWLIGENMVLPFGLNWIRMLVTVSLLWVMYLIYPIRATFDRKDWFRLFLCALTGIVINQLLFIKGLSMTYSIHATLLMLATPIFITILGAWFFKDKLTWLKWVGLMLGVAGASILILASQKGGNASDVLWGDIFVIINAISYSFYFILVKPLMQKYHPIPVTRILFSMGLVVALPFCWNEFSAIPWQDYTIKSWAVLAQITIGGTFLAYAFNIYGIKHLGPSVAGSYIYTQPVFAAIIAMSILGEPLEWYKLLAGLCIFTGVFLANKKAEKK